MYVFFPETSGRHLEEVDQIFRDSKNIFQPVKVSRMLPKGSLVDDVRRDNEKSESVDTVEKAPEL